MLLHHIGIACRDIDQTVQSLKKNYDIASVSKIIFDERQNAKLCLVETNNGITIELIAGSTVSNLLKKGISYYHLCFSVKDIFAEIKRLKSNGAIIVSPPKPAILFNNLLNIKVIYNLFIHIEL